MLFKEFKRKKKFSNHEKERKKERKEIHPLKTNKLI